MFVRLVIRARGEPKGLVRTANRSEIVVELHTARQRCDGDLEHLSEASSGANARASSLLLKPTD
jgi:hypothetical protein